MRGGVRSWPGALNWRLRIQPALDRVANHIFVLYYFIDQLEQLLFLYIYTYRHATHSSTHRWHWPVRPPWISYHRISALKCDHIIYKKPHKVRLVPWCRLHSVPLSFDSDIHKQRACEVGCMYIWCAQINRRWFSFACHVRRSKNSIGFCSVTDTLLSEM